MGLKHTLVLGTQNRKKGRELADLLAPYGFKLLTLADFEDVVTVVEDGDSFAANAALKATQQAVHLNHWVIGEDSGIVVDALDGAPGIYSARFGGENATDDGNNRRLLAELVNTVSEQRKAHYVCHMTVADAAGQIRAESEAICRGQIRWEPAGSGGFGYDPLFEIVEYHQTFGELGDTVKSILSHRSRAFRQLLPKLLELQGDASWTRQEP